MRHPIPLLTLNTTIEHLLTPHTFLHPRLITHLLPPPTPQIPTHLRPLPWHQARLHRHQVHKALLVRLARPLHNLVLFEDLQDPGVLRVVLQPEGLRAGFRGPRDVCVGASCEVEVEGVDGLGMWERA